MSCDLLQQLTEEVSRCDGADHKDKQQQQQQIWAATFQESRQTLLKFRSHSLLQAHWGRGGRGGDRGGLGAKGGQGGGGGGGMHEGSCCRNKSHF